MVTICFQIWRNTSVRRDYRWWLKSGSRNSQIFLFCRHPKTARSLLKMYAHPSLFCLLLLLFIISTVWQHIHITFITFIKAEGPYGHKHCQKQWLITCLQVERQRGVPVRWCDVMWCCHSEESEAQLDTRWDLAWWRAQDNRRSMAEGQSASVWQLSVQCHLLSFSRLHIQVNWHVAHGHLSQVLRHCIHLRSAACFQLENSPRSKIEVRLTVLTLDLDLWPSVSFPCKP